VIGGRLGAGELGRAEIALRGRLPQLRLHFRQLAPRHSKAFDEFRRGETSEALSDARRGAVRGVAPLIAELQIPRTGTLAL